FLSSRRRHTISKRDWSSDVCSSDLLARWMQVLQVRCGFRRLVVVAHSMGGLVARAFIERVAGDHAAPTINGIDTFVSISTPWGEIGRASCRERGEGGAGAVAGGKCA